MPECPDCERTFRGRACPTCGWRPSALADDRKPRTCALDGATLDAEGFCHAGGGFPVYLTCPFACPHCRQPLGWDGGCTHCHGAPTGRREDWTFPGDGYELVAGHWQREPDRPAGRPACTDAENTAGLAAVRAALAAAPDLPRKPSRT